MASIDGIDIPMMLDSDGVLRPAPTYSILKYSITLIGGTKSPTSILFDDFGNRDELSLARPSEGADVGPIAGHYRSDSTGTVVTIYPTNDGASMKSVGQFGAVEYRLRCLTDCVWRSGSGGWVPWAGLLTFDRDNGAFRFSNFHNRALYFRRVH